MDVRKSRNQSYFVLENDTTSERQRNSDLWSTCDLYEFYKKSEKKLCKNLYKFLKHCQKLTLVGSNSSFLLNLASRQQSISYMPNVASFYIQDEYPRQTHKKSSPPSGKWTRAYTSSRDGRSTRRRGSCKNCFKAT